MTAFTPLTAVNKQQVAPPNEYNWNHQH